MYTCVILCRSTACMHWHMHATARAQVEAACCMRALAYACDSEGSSCGCLLHECLCVRILPGYSRVNMQLLSRPFTPGKYCDNSLACFAAFPVLRSNASGGLGTNGSASGAHWQGQHRVAGVLLARMQTTRFFIALAQSFTQDQLNLYLVRPDLVSFKCCRTALSRCIYTRGYDDVCQLVP